MPRKPKLHNLPFFGPVRSGTEPTFANCPGCEDWEKKLADDDPEKRAFFVKLRQKTLPALHHATTVAWMEKQYKETKNPFFAWHVYASYKKRNYPLPAWIEEYLNDIARRVLEIEEYSSKAAGYMLGFSDTPTGEGKGRGKGGGSKPCQQFNRIWLQHNIPKEVTLRISKFPHKKIETICDEIIRDWKLNLTSDMLRKYYNAAPKYGIDWDLSWEDR